MLWFSFTSLHTRLTALVILAVLPLYAFTLFILWNNWQIDNYNYTVLTLLATAVIALIWMGSEFLLLRWVRVLTRVSQQLAMGDKARIDGLLNAPAEIRQLAQTFNQMAAFLEQQLTELRRVEEELRESEEQFSQIAENIREVLWLATPGASQMIYVNSMYEKMWGRTCASLYAQPRSFLEGFIQRIALPRSLFGEHVLNRLRPGVSHCTTR